MDHKYIFLKIKPVLYICSIKVKYEDIFYPVRFGHTDKINYGVAYF